KHEPAETALTRRGCPTPLRPLNDSDNMRILLIGLVYSIYAFLPLHAQTGQGSRATIVVVPYTPNIADIKPLLDESFEYAAAINEISRAFENEGFLTVDFVEKYRAAGLRDIQSMDQFQTEFARVAAEIPADIRVQVRLNLIPSNYGKRLEAIIDAVDHASQTRLRSSGVMTSQPSRAGGYSRPLQSLMRDPESGFKAFMEGLAESFNEIRAEGARVQIEFGISENSPYDMNTDIGEEGYILSDMIQDLVKDQVKSWYREGLIRDVIYNKGTTDRSRIIFDRVSVPFTTKDGDRFDSEDFIRELRRKVRLLGKQSEKGDMFDVNTEQTGNRFFITIEG
ncbi:MAG: DUF6175 family protein, partial [Bacteroidota bacterium]